MTYKNYRDMEIENLISECIAYDFRLMLEEKKPKSWLKSVSAFANGLGGSLFLGVDNDVGDLSEIKLTERQQNMIKENPSISAKQMSETLSVSSRTIERDLSLMKKMAS